MKSPASSCSAITSCSTASSCAVPLPRRQLESRAIDSFLDLQEDDLVVHLSHGIARYRGMHVLEKNGQTEEHLILEFAGGTRVYVPASKIDLVQKYVGGAKTDPELSKLGGTALAAQEGARRGGGPRPGQRDGRAPGPARGQARRRLPGRQRMAARVRGRLPLRGDARPAHHHGRDQARHGTQPGRWTASSAATSATARPSWPSGPPSRPSTTAGRSPCWCRPPCWPSSISAPSASASPSIRSSSKSISRFRSRRRAEARSSNGWQARRRRHHHRHASARLGATCSSRTSAWSSSTRSSASASSTRNGSRSCGKRWTC